MTTSEYNKIINNYISNNLNECKKILKGKEKEFKKRALSDKFPKKAVYEMFANLNIELN